MVWEIQGMSVENGIDRLETLIAECDRTLKFGITTGRRSSLYQTWETDHSAMQKTRDAKSRYVEALYDLKTYQLERRIKKLEDKR